MQPADYYSLCVSSVTVRSKVKVSLGHQPLLVWISLILWKVHVGPIMSIYNHRVSPYNLEFGFHGTT